MTQNLISRTSARLQPFITRFIKDALVHGNVAESELGKHSHEVIYELYVINPSLLDLVLPQLEPELGIAEVEPRLRAVQLVGRLAGRPNSTLSTKFQHLFLALLGRFNDLEVDIRKEMVEFGKHYLKNHDGKSELKEVNERLLERLRDPDETVRRDAVEAVCHVAQSQPGHIHETLMKELQDRTRDRKKEIRKEAQTLLAQVSLQLAEANQDKHQARFRIPNSILSCYLLPDFDDKQRAEALFTQIITSPASVEASVKLLMDVVKEFGETEWRALSVFFREKKAFQQLLANFLRSRKEKLPDGDPEVEKLIRELAARLPGADVRDRLKEFYNHKDEKPMSMLLDICSGALPRSKVKELGAEIERRVGALKHPGRTELVKRLVRRASFSLVTIDSMNEIFKYVLDSLEEADEPASLKFLQLLSLSFPQLLTRSFKSIIEFLKKGDDTLVRTALEMMANCAGNLGPEEKTLAKSVQKRLISLANEGSEEVIKLALRTVEKLYDAATLREILEGHLKNLSGKLESKPATIKAIGCLAKRPSIDLKASQEKAILEAFVKVAGAKSADLASRCLAVDGLVAILVPRRVSDSTALKVLECLGQLMVAPAPVLRSHAACGVLRIARTRQYDIGLTVFHQLANFPQDTSEVVRREFAGKLAKGLKSLTGLPVYYLSLFAFYGGSDHQTLALVRRSMDALIGNLRRVRPVSQALLPENCLPWLIHTISSSPEFDAEYPKFERTLTFLDFMLERLFHQADNYSFIMQMLALIRKCSDAHDATKTRNNRMVCEIGLKIVGQKKDVKGWSFSKELTNQILPNLPKSLYQYDEEEQNENFLPPEFEYRVKDSKQRILNHPPTPQKELGAKDTPVKETPSKKRAAAVDAPTSKPKVQVVEKKSKAATPVAPKTRSPASAKKSTPMKPVKLDSSSANSPSPKAKSKAKPKASKPKAPEKGEKKTKQTTLTKDAKINRERSASPVRGRKK